MHHKIKLLKSFDDEDSRMKVPEN